MKFIKNEPVTLNFGLMFSTFKEVIQEDRYRNFLSENSYEYLRKKIKELPYELSIYLGHSPDYSYENKLIAIKVKNYEDVPTIHKLISKEIKLLKEIFSKSSEEQLKEISMIHNKEQFIEKMEQLEHEMIIEKKYNKLNKKINTPNVENNLKSLKAKI